MITLLLLALSAIAAAQDFEFLPVNEAMPMSYHSDGNDLVVDWVIKPEHYMYREMTSISLAEGEDATLGEMRLPNHFVEKYDETFDEVLPIYHDYQTLRVAVQATEPVDLVVRYQGCAEAGLCYPPQTHTVTYDPAGQITGGTDDAEQMAQWGQAPTPTGTAATGLPINYTSGGLAEFLASGSLLFSIGLFFVLGIGLVFTPCVLPMIPIMSALVLGENRPSTPRATVIALVYVVAMALTYALAGVVAASLGAAGNIQAALQTPWILTVFALVFVLLALAMFGVFNLQTPGPLNNAVVGLQNRIQGGGLLSVAGIGSLSALVVSPCVTAPLAGALIYISATGNAMLGFSTLFALGLGMGVPLILVAVGGARWIPRSGPWMSQVKAVFGVLLLGVAIWLLSRWINPTISLALWGTLAVGYAISLGVLDPFRATISGAASKVRKFAAVLLMVYGVAALWGSLGGGADPLRPIAANRHSEADADEHPFYRLADVPAIRAQLAQAAAAGEPVMLDLYADWCISCRVMERRIFAQGDVQALLGDHRWLQLDVTAFDASHQAMLDQYRVFGPPAILFFDADGTWNPERSIIGEVSKSGFLQHLGLI